jgi:hypothetical protein
MMIKELVDSLKNQVDDTGDGERLQAQWASLQLYPSHPWYWYLGIVGWGLLRHCGCITSQNQGP